MTFYQMISIVGIVCTAGGVARAESLPSSALATAAAPFATYTDPEARRMLQLELVEFERYAESTMKSALEILKSRKSSAAELKKVDEWQRAQFKRLQSALHQDDPLLALVDAWAVSKSLSRYMEQHDVADGVSAVGIDMLKRREDRLAYIATRYLSPETIAALSSRLDAFTLQQPIPPNEELVPESRWWSAPFFSAWSTGQAAVEGVFQMSLIPGRALKGVSESGTALSGIRETTAEALLVIDRLPATIRAEFQLALDDLIAKRSEIIEILSAVDAVSTNLRVTAQSTQRTAVEVQESMTLARELLPAGESLAKAVERAVIAAADLMRTIGVDAAPGATPEGTEGQHQSFEIAEYQKTAVALTGAATEIRLMLGEIRALVDRPESGESTDEDQGFDVREYKATADSIQSSTAEVRALIRDLYGLAGDKALQERIAVLRDEAEAVTQRAAERANGVVDHLTVRLIQVAFVVFFLACGYAWLQRRFRQK